MRIVVCVAILITLCGCSEKSRVASQFRKMYEEDSYEKVTGVYVYPLKKEHHYKIEFSVEWPARTVYCTPRNFYYEVGCHKYDTIECNCTDEHSSIIRGFEMTYDHDLGLGFYDKRVIDRLKKCKHDCKTPCGGHYIEAGAEVRSILSYLGPDGKLYIQYSTIRTIE